MSEQKFVEKYMVPMTRKKFFDFFRVNAEVFSNKRILNVGAGGSNFEEELGKHQIHPASVVNIDLGYDPNRKSKLWRLVFKLPRSMFPPNVARTDWDNLPFGEKNFDTSILLFSAAFWAEQLDFDHIASEVMRVTKESVFINGVSTENIQRLTKMTESGDVGFRLLKLQKGYELKKIV